MEIGIDIGPSYSSAAVLENGKAVPIKPGKETVYSIPSAVYAEGEKLVIGRMAEASRKRDPSWFKANFKRDFGSREPYLLGEKKVRPEQIYTEFYKFFLDSARQYTGERVEKAYLTHPAQYGKEKRELLKKAAQNAGLFDVELVQEPVAAGFSFFSDRELNIGETLLVYDFGGGTFDTTLLKMEEGGLRLLGEPMGMECGGTSFDRMLYQHLIQKLSGEEELLEALKRPKFKWLVTEQTVEAKHFLSSSESITVNIPMNYGDFIECTISQQEFEGLIQEKVRDSLDIVKKMLKKYGVELKDVDKFLCVGGSTRIPYITKQLEALAGKPVLCSVDPELAVCCGAALKGKVKIQGSAAETEGKRPVIEGGRGPASGKVKEPGVKWSVSGESQRPEGKRPVLGEGRGPASGEEKDLEVKWSISAEPASGWWISPPVKKNPATETKQAEGTDKKRLSIPVSSDPASLGHPGKSKETGAGEAKAWKPLPNGNEKRKEEEFCRLADRVGEEKALEQFEWDAKGGNIAAQYFLGKIYCEGTVRTAGRDEKKAFFWAEKAAWNGHPGAQVLVGRCYRFGIGTKADNKKAYYWYERAAKQGDARGRLYLGEAYHEGTGVKKDDSKAVKCYHAARDEGSAEAAYRLGQHYENGWGVEKRSTTAETYYRQAAAAGIVKAKEKLESMLTPPANPTQNSHKTYSLTSEPLPPKKNIPGNFNISEKLLEYEKIAAAKGTKGLSGIFHRWVKTEI